MYTVSFKVNGRFVEAKVYANTLLVDFLREDLNLTGTHVGCETSQCGACVILANGESIKSCAMLAVEAEGFDITTIEGVANVDGTLSVIQESFRENHGLQCGFCTPGMVLTATDLIKRNKTPTELEIKQYLEGNICRCTGYQNIIKAIKAASNELNNREK